MSTKSHVLSVHADREPMPGVGTPGPNQIFRSPQLRLETRELGLLHPDFIRVKIIYAGICGTDVHVMQTDPETGYIRGSAPLDIGAEGRVLGHEGVGEVLEIGSHVDNVQPGDFVTFESIITCHHCIPCRKGRFNQCERAVLFGMESDGLFGSIIDAPALLAHCVNDLASMDRGLVAAACIEPAGCGYVALTHCKVGPGDSVVIFGAGPIGFFTAMLCRTAFGAGAIHVVEPVPFRRQLASKWADTTYSPEAFFDNPPTDPIDVMIEASGEVGNVDQAFLSLGPNGRVVLLARSGKPMALRHIDHMITNNISILGSRGHLCGAFSDVLRLYRAGRVPLHEAVTEIVSGLEGLKTRLEDPASVVETNCKVLAKIST